MAANCLCTGVHKQCKVVYMCTQRKFVYRCTTNSTRYILISQSFTHLKTWGKYKIENIRKCTAEQLISYIMEIYCFCYLPFYLFRYAVDP